MDKVNKTPHDDFFRQALSHIDVARDLFSNLIPPDILKYVDLETLKPEKDTFIDHSFSKGASDALFSVKLGQGEGYIYLLSEHQSSVDHFMSFRIRKYESMIMDFHRKKHPDEKYLALVYPLVIYNGTFIYNAPCDFFELFQDPELARKLLMGPHQLIDLSRLEDEEILKYAISGLMCFIMKHIYDPDITPQLLKITVMLEEQADKRFIYIRSVFEYIINKAQAKDFGRIIEIFKEVTPDENREDVMTIAEQLMQKGEERGILIGEQIGEERGISIGKQIGEEETLESIVVNLYSMSNTIEVIAKATGLSIKKVNEIIKKIKKN